MASLIELRLPTERTCALTSVSAAPRLRRRPPRGGFISGPRHQNKQEREAATRVFKGVLRRRKLSMSTSFNSAGFFPELDPGAPKIYGHGVHEQQGRAPSGPLIETKSNTEFRRVLTQKKKPSRRQGLRQMTSASKTGQPMKKKSFTSRLVSMVSNAGVFSGKHGGSDC